MDMLVGRDSGVEAFEEDALREVLAMERQAQGIIQDAEAEAQRIVALAKQRAQEMKRSAEVETAEKEQATLRQAYEDIEQEASAIEVAADDAAKAWLATAQTCFDAAVSYVLGAVTLGELDGRAPESDDLRDESSLGPRRS
jgi:vacuolar-type H+-ATPase subunit H